MRALAAEQDVILMDEPFSALDPISREQLQNDLLHLNEELGKTILFVTHDMNEALKLGSRNLSDERWRDRFHRYEGRGTSQ